MTTEPLEFLISQYLDGTLSAGEQAALELRLERDAEARAMLEEYRSLEGVLKASLPLPDVRWDRLADHVSAAVARAGRGEGVLAKIGPAEEDQTRAGTRANAFPGPWGRFVRLAVAACLLAGAGVGVYLFQGQNAAPVDRVANGTQGLPPAPQVIRGPVENTVVAEVVGPQAETTQGVLVSEVTVGGPAVAADLENWRGGEGIFSQAPRLSIGSVSSSASSSTEEGNSLPYYAE